MDETVATRVAGLIDRYFEGKVNAAAKVWGVPQRTLARLVDDEIAHPRADVLAAIARGVGASLDWLVTGDGQGPPDTSPTGDPLHPAWLAFASQIDILERAGLERDERVALLPFATRWAFIRLAEKLGSTVTPSVLNAAIDASRLEVSAWVTLLGGLMLEFGGEAVAGALNQLKAETILGFNGYGLHLLRDGKLRVDLEAEFDAYPPRIGELRVADARGRPPEAQRDKRRKPRMRSRS